MLSLLMGFFSSKNNIIITILVAVIVGMFVYGSFKIAGLNLKLANKESEIVKLKNEYTELETVLMHKQNELADRTIMLEKANNDNIALTDQMKSNDTMYASVTKSLQDTISKQRKEIGRLTKEVTQFNNIIASATTIPITKGVIDDESSKKVVTIWSERVASWNLGMQRENPSN